MRQSCSRLGCGLWRSCCLCTTRDGAACTTYATLPATCPLVLLAGTTTPHTSHSSFCSHPLMMILSYPPLLPAGGVISLGNVLFTTECHLVFITKYHVIFTTEHRVLFTTEYRWVISLINDHRVFWCPNDEINWNILRSLWLTMPRWRDKWENFMIITVDDARWMIGKFVNTIEYVH